MRGERGRSVQDYGAGYRGRGQEGQGQSQVIVSLGKREVKCLKTRVRRKCAGKERSLLQGPAAGRVGVPIQRVASRPGATSTNRPERREVGERAGAGPRGSPPLALRPGGGPGLLLVAGGEALRSSPLAAMSLLRGERRWFLSWGGEGIDESPTRRILPGQGGTYL